MRKFLRLLSLFFLAPLLGSLVSAWTWFFFNAAFIAPFTIDHAVVVVSSTGTAAMLAIFAYDFPL